MLAAGQPTGLLACWPAEPKLAGSPAGWPGGCPIARLAGFTGLLAGWMGDCWLVGWLSAGQLAGGQCGLDGFGRLRVVVVLSGWWQGASQGGYHYFHAEWLVGAC